MKKRALVSCVLAAALLLSACSGDSGRRSRRDRDRDDDERGSRFERETEETEESAAVTTEETRATETTAESTAETLQTVSLEVRNAAYASFLEIIEDNEDEIRTYNWMSMTSSSNGVMIPDDNYPLALYDITGDGLEELFLMKTENNIWATLEVYAYDAVSATSYEILTVDNLDVLAGGGGRYAIVPLDPGFLFVFTSEGDEDWTEAYTIYQFNGSEMFQSGYIEEYSHPNDDYTEYVSEYSMNGEEISEADYDDARAEVFDYVEALLQYNYLTEADMISTVSSVEFYAMTYDDMHAMLSNAN